ncbi:MAG: GGDEF domain-containing protein [Pseudohongiellaceae bacterium]
MATAMRQSNTIEFDSAKRLILSKNSESEFDSEHQALRLKLTSILQSTLDLEQMLSIFYEEITQLFHFNGFVYQHENQLIKTSSGKKTTHSCGYRITTAQDHLGEITFYRSRRFKEAELEFIEETLSALIWPLRNALQYRQALKASLTDPLTGIGNRLALDNTLLREVELAKRHSSSLSLLVIDLDNFKIINDSYGHKTGDLVLQRIAKELAAVNRQTDLSFRYGGEEFVVLLNKTNPKGAIVIGERIRAAIERASIKVRNQTLNVTVSIGASSLKQNDNRYRLFQRADKALYQAKKSGKNQVLGI